MDLARVNQGTLRVLRQDGGLLLGIALAMTWLAGAAFQVLNAEDRPNATTSPASVLAAVQIALPVAVAVALHSTFEIVAITLALGRLVGQRFRTLRLGSAFVRSFLIVFMENMLILWGPIASI